MTELEQERDRRRALLNYIITTDSFKRDLLEGRITTELLASWGIRGEIKDDDLVFDLI